MDKSVRVCVDRDRGALPLQYALPSETIEDLRRVRGAPELVFFPQKLWEPGSTLRIRFLEGSPKVQNKVKEMAMDWTNYANLKFQFVDDDDADIQIAFKQGDGSWSYIGTDANTIPKGEPTMNYGWFDENTDDEEFSRTTKHEFGHALGCPHEHQNPAGGINWNKKAVYADLSGPPNFWDQETIDHNIFERYSKTITQYTEVDPQSIMMYWIPRHWTNDGKSYGEGVFDLSDTDKEFIKLAYPSGKAAKNTFQQRLQQYYSKR